MSTFDAFRYDASASSSSVELPAWVRSGGIGPVGRGRGHSHGLRRGDFARAQAIHVNLADKDSIDAAIDACDGRSMPSCRAQEWRMARRGSRRSTSSDTAI